MKIQLFTIFFLSMFWSQNISAQASLEGIWKGESICQVKNSPCHDEKIVYHISKDSLPNGFIVVANKIVNGKEEYMGTIKFTYDRIKSTFISIDAVNDARWEFQVAGTKMSGKLVYKNELYRLVNIEKKN
jgi:hypothetical protein